MRQSRTISARRLTTWLAGGLIAANLLTAAAYLTDWLVVKIALFFCLAFLPGAALLRIMHITFKAFSVGTLYCLGLSILVLMISGVVLNQLLLLFNVPHPLETPNIIAAWDIATACLIALAIAKNRRPVRFHMRPLNRLPKPAWILLALASLLPCLAVFGAFRLNNGSDGALALFALCYGAVLVGYACLRWRYIPHEALALFVFILALSILFMTSLRGWDIFGHDIEREFKAYMAVHLHGQWNMRLTADPYNACLSITILPEMFAKLLNISGLAVFKVVLQVLFAACSVAVYALLRRYVSKLGALAGTILFICYPTFINDSAMLTRQGVAYLFFSLAILMATNQLLRRRFRLLFLLCALGVVVSHYSTAYMLVALCLLGVIIKWLLGRWAKKHMISTVQFFPLYLPCWSLP